MRWLLRIVLILVLLIVALFVLQWVASESGEVVVVGSKDAAGEIHETRLWVVDHDGSAWLRSGSPAAAWYARMRADPNVTIERGDQRFVARIEALPDQRDVINDLMNSKYGWADDLIGLMFGRDDAIPLRLHRD